MCAPCNVACVSYRTHADASNPGASSLPLQLADPALGSPVLLTLDECALVVKRFISKVPAPVIPQFELPLLFSWQLCSRGHRTFHPLFAAVGGVISAWR